MGWLKKIDCRANGKAVFGTAGGGVNFICIYGVKSVDYLQTDSTSHIFLEKLKSLPACQ